MTTQQLLNGLAAGSVYALFALGFALILRVQYTSRDRPPRKQEIQTAVHVDHFQI